MAPDHAELQRDIPDYTRGTIDSLRRRRLENHLAGCRECEELVVAATAIATRLAESTPPGAGTHPPSPMLARYANSEDLAGRDGIARHLALCESCALEVEVLRRRSAEPIASTPAALSGSGGRKLALTLAAGIAFGALTGFLGSLALLRPPSSAGWSGTAPLLLIDEPVRGDESPVRVERMPGQPFVPLGVRLRPVDEVHRYRFLILGHEGKAVWETELASQEVEAQRQRSWIVSCLVPSEVLPPGAYSMRVDATGPAGSNVVLQRSFTVDR